MGGGGHPKAAGFSFADREALHKALINKG